MKRHVLILGAGFGGLELATRLSETASDAVDVTLLDRNDSFYFGFSKLEVMLGRQSADAVRLPYRDIAKDGVEFRQETVVGIDPAARRVATDAGAYDADFLVVAMGADYDMAATPGFEAGGHEYYTLAGAERLRDALAGFDGGRVLVSVLGQPFKCPPAPFEGSFLLHEHFTQRGIRDAVQMATTFPMQRPVPVTGEVSQMFRDGLAERGHRGASPAPRHQHRPGRAHGAARRAARRCPTTCSSASRCTGRPTRSRPRAWRSTAGCPSTRPTSGPEFPASTPSATSAPARGPSPRPGSSPSRPRWSSPTTSPRRSPARSPGAVRGVGRLLRRVRRRARQQGRGQLPAAAPPRRPSVTSPRASTPPRRRSSARPAARAGSDPNRDPAVLRGHRLG